MGSTYLFDIIASFIIAVSVMLSVHKTHGYVRQSNLTTGSDLITQTNLITVVGMIEKDFRRIGYCANPTAIVNPALSITEATSKSIKFITDVDAGGGDGIVDTVQYTVGDSTGLLRTPNKSDRLLFRVVKSPTASSRSSIAMSVGLTNFELIYLNFSDNVMTVPVPQASLGQIRSIQLSVKLENPYPYDTVNTYAYWRQIRLTAKNLNNR